MLVRNETRDLILGDAIGIADTSLARQKGLLGRASLASGQGLWIVPCESIHTFGMRFPIDALYLDRKRRVHKIRKSMRPWRISASVLAHSVLELPAGTIERTGTQRGDQLVFLDEGRS